MKTRIGFVSNSSSCSFCVYGVNLDISEVQEKLKVEVDLSAKTRACSCKDINEKDPYCSKCGCSMWKSYERWETDQLLSNNIAQALHKHNLEYYASYESDYCVVGLDLEGRKNDKKLQTDLKNTEKLIKEWFDIEPQFLGGEIQTS
jgi:hypothetical protein